MSKKKNETLAEDLLTGAAAIGVYVKSDTRRAFYLLERGLIPGFKIGKIWHARKSRLEAHYGKSEEAASEDYTA